MKRLVLVVLAGIIFLGCSKEKEEVFTKEQLRMFKYLPNDVQLVLYSNIHDLRKTSHWEEIIKPSLNSGQKEDWLTEFEEQTGAGWNKGVAEVYTATTWDGNNIVAVTFDSDPKPIARYFENKTRFTPSDISGKKVYTLLNNPFSKFYFPDSSTLLIIKNEDYLSSVIEKKNESLADNKKFMGLLNKINLKKHYWMASDQGNLALTIIQMLAGNTRGLPVNKIVKSIDDITLAAEFSDEVQVESVLNCKDEKSAYLLSAAIRSALAMDLFSGSSNNLSEIMDKIKVERESERLNLEINLNKDDILKLKDISKKRQIDNNL